MGPYLYCNNDGLVGPKRLLGSHFNGRSPNSGPWHQEAFFINVHNGNLLKPIQDTVAQRCCAIPLENKTELFTCGQPASLFINRKPDLENQKFQGKYLFPLFQKQHFTWPVNRETNTTKADFLSSATWGIYCKISAWCGRKEGGALSRKNPKAVQSPCK